MRVDEISELLFLIGKSKKIKRSGWVREGVVNPESVAEHSFRLITIAMLLAPILHLDQDKLIKMAILHDIAEVKTGDIVVERWGKVDLSGKKNKEKLEMQGIEKMFSKHPQKEEYIAIFHEMIKQKTELSKLFKQLDKLEMVLQAYEYEQEQKKDLSEFFVDAKVYIIHPFLKAIYEQVLAERKL